MRKDSSSRVPGVVYYAPHALILLVFVLGNLQLSLEVGFGSDFREIYGDGFFAQAFEGGFWFGGILIVSYLVSRWFDRRSRRLVGLMPRRKPVVLRGAFGIGLFMLAMMLIADGGNFIYREMYIAGSGFAGIFVGLALMSLPMIAAMQKKDAYGAFFLLAAITVAFSNATRVGALIPVIYILTRIVSGNGSLGSRKTFLLCVLSFLTYGLALTSRSIFPHGLIPYAEFYFSQPSAIGLSVLSVFENFSSNYVNFLATLSVAKDDFDAAYLAVIVDPRSGEAAGWNDISARYRIHPFIPYSGYAELARLGYVSSAAFIVLVLAFYNHIAVRTWRSPPREKIFHILALLSLLVFFVLMFSYNARSGFRWLYLAMVLWSGATALRLFRSWKSFH